MQHQKGVTLVELIIAIAILATVTAIAVPSMANFFNRHQSYSIRNNLFDLIALGRSKAYGLGKVYTLCARSSKNTCTSDWSLGALLFLDMDGDGELDTEDTIERVMPRLPSGASLNWNSFGNRNYLQYRPNGRTRSQSGNFSYCPPDQNPENGWVIVLNAAGRPYFGKDSDNDGIKEAGSGANLNCTSM